ncbi:hypothetical protein AOQ84DRAFT_353805 [Glonium stellatum]|uniref:Uncharacterized protein n=1 Tax=Glonium stellatum TaxID=574774 RepID=A0A8E2JUF8_9PEZI|nr:hypothetical protein AOQ84DRAFT_353805 [Glonium stellatum]
MSKTLSSLNPIKRDKTINPQASSPFLNLPAELRNQIYEYYFDNLTSSAHSLALLLSCRRIYNEAHTLAFATATFVTTTWVRYKLAAQSAALRPASVAAISSIAFASHLLESRGFCRDNQYLLANFMAGCITLFPALRRVTLFYPDQARSGPEWYAEANKTNLSAVVWAFVSGQVMAWPKAEPWSVVWPEEGDGPHTQCILERAHGQSPGACDVKVFYVDGEKMDESVVEAWWRLPVREIGAGLGFQVDGDATLAQKVKRSRRRWERKRMGYLILFSPVVVPMWMGKKVKQAWTRDFSGESPTVRAWRR